MRLNLVFHNIVLKEEEINGDYSLTLDYFEELRENIETLLKSGLTRFKDIRYYFDDGYKSFKELVFPVMKDKTNLCCLAPIANLLGSENYLNEGDIDFLSKSGIKIASHGFSHAALAVYKANTLQKTPKGGEYKDSPSGKNEILSEKEVLFQFLESKRLLENITKSEIDEFVFPYGLYNKEVIDLNNGKGIYKYLSTCDEHLDNGSAVRPRILVSNKCPIKETVEFIRSLE